MSKPDKTIDRYEFVVDAVTGYPIIRDKATDNLLMMAYVAERMNRYEYVLDVARSVVSDAQTYAPDMTLSVIPASTVNELRLITSPGKTSEQLLQDWQDAANHLEHITNMFLRNKASKEQIKIANGKLRYARLANEASKP